MFTFKRQGQVINLTTWLTSFYVDYICKLDISFINTHYITLITYIRLRVLLMLITIYAMVQEVQNDQQGIEIHLKEILHMTC
jgi:hypothetical protein